MSFYEFKLLVIGVGFGLFMGIPIGAILFMSLDGWIHTIMESYFGEDPRFIAVQPPEPKEKKPVGFRTEEAGDDEEETESG